MLSQGYLANLAAISARANASRLRQYRDELRGLIGYLRNVRRFPAHYDGLYVGGAGAVERSAASKIREVWASYRAFRTSLSDTGTITLHPTQDPTP